jgi:hypothetical protein
MSNLNIVYLLSGALLFLISLFYLCVKYILNKNVSFKAVTISILICFLLTAVSYWIHPIFSVVVVSILIIIHLINFYLIFFYVEYNEEEDKKYVGEIDPIDVAHQMCEEYMQYEYTIQSIVNSPKPHSDLQVAQFIQLRKKQAKILEEYQELDY